VTSPPALHPQVQALIDAWAQDGKGDLTVAPDLQALRAGYLDTALRLGGAAEEVAEVQDVVLPRDEARVPARLYRPRVPAPVAGAIVWLHGGGWVMGDLDGFDRVCRALCNAAGHAVLSVDYRLAPECCFPAGVQDADAAVRWARAEGAQRLGCGADRILVGGDSAGGNLAAVAALHARHDGLPPLRGQLLVYPALDPGMAGAAYHQFCDGPGLTRTEMELCWRTYLGAADPADPDAAPLGADVAGAPPAAIALAGIDPLRDDGARYAQRLRDAGVPVELEVYDDMIHGFLRWGGVVDRAHELIRWLADRSRALLA